MRRQRKRAARRVLRYTEIIEDSDLDLARNISAPVPPSQPQLSIPQASQSASVAGLPQIIQNLDLSDPVMSPSSRTLVEEFHAAIDDLEQEDLFGL